MKFFSEVSMVAHTRSIWPWDVKYNVERGDNGDHQRDNQHNDLYKNGNDHCKGWWVTF